MLKTVLTIIGSVFLIASAVCIPWIVYIIKFCDSICKGDM